MEKIILEKIDDLNYEMTEALRSLRTNLIFCGDDIKVVLFTSAEPNEGKSNTTMHLAWSLAESGKKVILLDCDIRKSVMVGQYGMHLEGKGKIFGMSHYLTGQKSLDEVIYSTNIEGMDLVTAGPVVPNPTELLENHYFDEMITKLRMKYDMILLDGSPLGLVIDSAVMAPKCDGAILVIEQGNASRKFILSVKNQLEASGVRILGAVLNKVKKDTDGYYKKYYSGDYGYYRESRKE